MGSELITKQVNRQTSSGWSDRGAAKTGRRTEKLVSGKDARLVFRRADKYEEMNSCSEVENK